MKHRNWKNRLLALTLCAIMVMNYGMVALADTVSTGDAKGDTASKAEINPTVTPGDALNVDLTADVEEASVWEATLPALTGVYGDDVAAIAVSQLGYTESAVNVEQDSEGNITGHYSRYGAWNETPYAEWHALLAKFCVSYAQIPQDRFPVADNAAAWVDVLADENCGMFVPAAEEYEAMRGDLVFLDTDGMDGVDSVAVISEVAADGTLTVICEKDDAVVSESCGAADERIYGYGMMPFNMEGIEADTLELSKSTGHQPDTTIEYPNVTYDKDTSEEVTDSDVLELNKTINDNRDTNAHTFELTLDAYVTGQSAMEKDTSGYFHASSSAAALAKAFAAVAESSDVNISTSISLDEETVMRDQISQYFEHYCTCGATDNTKHTCIKVYTSDYDGEKFSDDLKQVYPLEGGDEEEIKLINAANLQVTVNDKTVDVTGFAYNQYPVELGQAGGKKLVVKVAVETEAGFWGGNGVPTNEVPENLYDTTGAAIYLNDQVVEAFPLPTADVPLYVDIQSIDATVYYGIGTTPDKVLGKVTAGYKTTNWDGEGTDPTDPKNVADLEVTYDKVTGTWKPVQDWMDDYAEITVTKPKSFSSREYGAYTYTAAATPKKTDGSQTAVTDSSESNIYILVPAVRYQDLVIDKGTKMTREMYLSYNLTQVNGATVNWIRKVDEADQYPEEIPQVTGTQPSVHLTYSPVDQVINEETPVNVVKAQYDSLAASKYEGLLDVIQFGWKDCTATQHTETQDIVTHMGSDADVPEFWLHISDHNTIDHVSPNYWEQFERIPAPEPNDPEDGVLNLDKTVAEDGSTDEFKLTLEAYATGNQVKMEVAQPTDIVLVLDRSGSMAQADYKLKVSKGTGTDNYYDTGVDLIPGFVYYDSTTSGGRTTAMTNPIVYCEAHQAWEMRKVDPEGTILSEVIKTIDLTDASLELYEKNMQATDRAVRAFLYQLKAQAKAYGVVYRVAIADYCKDQANLYDGTTKKAASKITADTAYSSAVKVLYDPNNKDDSDLDELLASMDVYSYAPYIQGVTPTHLGMNLAEKVLEEGMSDSKAAKMVVLFADGGPGDGKKYYTQWANKAMETSQEIKNDGASVFVVGLYDSASSDPKNMYTGSSDSILDKNTSEYFKKSNRLFNYISSNYTVKQIDVNAKNANGISCDGVKEVSPNPDETAEYFMGAQSAEALLDGFKKITMQTEVETASVELDATTVLRDDISKYFEWNCECTEEELQDGIHDCIEVYVADYDHVSKTFGAERMLYPEKADAEKDAAIKIIVNPNGKRIDVSGFDYGKYAVIEKPVEGETPDGKKLIVKIPIETEVGFWGGNNVPTNEATSGIYFDQDQDTMVEEAEVVQHFPIPEANVPLRIAIDAQDKTIYYGGDITESDVLVGITAGYKTTIGDTSASTTDEIADIPVTIGENRRLQPAESWMDDYANISWVKDPLAETKGKVDNKDCGIYEYEVRMTPIYDGTEGNNTNNTNHSNIAGTRVDAEGKAVADTGNVHVLVPVVKFRDETVYWGIIPDKAFFEAKDRVTADREIQWVDIKGDTGITEALADPETRPALNFEYAPLADTKFTVDTPVNVTVESSYIDGVTGDITNVTTFEWEACNGVLHDSPVEDTTTPHKGSVESQEFWIHVTAPYELPSTGGYGTYWYTISGLILMMGAALVMHRNKCKEVLRRR